MKEKLSMILSMVVFGTIGIFIEYIDMPSGFIAAARGIIGASVILVVMLITGHKTNFKKLSKKLPVLLASGVAIGFNWILLFEAYRHTGIPAATVCYYMAPLLVVGVSPFIFKDKLTLRQIICILIALMGVVSVSGIFQTNASKIIGVLSGLGAAVLYASVMIMNKFMGETDDYERTFIQLSVAGLVVLPYGILTMGDIEFNTKSTVLLVIVGVVHTGIAYLVYFGAIKKLKSRTVAILSYIDPASAIVLSSIVFMQMPKVYEIIGVVLIMGAAILSETEKRRGIIKENKKTGEKNENNRCNF
ncbi:MAG: DMT family transporter [Clostridia bacterium]|nr:DMT family transporter [Clostridia bacterium]